MRVNDGLRQEVFSEFRAEVSVLPASVQFISDKFDSSNALVNEIKKDMDAIRKVNATLFSSNYSLESKSETYKNVYGVLSSMAEETPSGSAVFLPLRMRVSWILSGTSVLP